ncbi:formate dehydrogenase accessory sulfurtransferase FdhD [Pseudomarimonas arenosa]|uniref:Sulfur carrier protein FdhD n=1 Tax=Pseudomarimonas arenosa TaxID=2774145 RepID=A0AAW3ZMX1_9GAMM|nr:formate dehydrogenase accessory sulfurtransferase FdhD [Pseudomarimonas arenosa]MBD8525989.1 formate dehydrogenase accessory sulfurtransferase FdhD [Pseudomarimonas arenosa]
MSSDPQSPLEADFDQRITELLSWLGQQAEGASQARICKQLGWSASELQRCLSVLQPTPEQGGLGLIEAVPWRDQRNRDQNRYRLSAGGRQLFGIQPSAAEIGSECAPDGSLVLPALCQRDGMVDAVQDAVAHEVPVALLYNDQPHAVMLASPTDLEDFALGFALSEGIVQSPAEYRLVEVRSDDQTGQGYAVHAHIPQTRFDALLERRRVLSGRSGCGACGSELLRMIDGEGPPVGNRLRLSLREVAERFSHMAARQPLNAACGGVHAAAWWSGSCLIVREDIGRHNAVDKVIGASCRSLQRCDWPDARPACLLVTSRASYEIVHKAIRAGIEAVFAISAPTSLAIELAQRSGLTLGAFVREQRCTLYAHPQRCEELRAREIQ